MNDIVHTFQYNGLLENWPMDVLGAARRVGSRKPIGAAHELLHLPERLGEAHQTVEVVVVSNGSKVQCTRERGAARRAKGADRTGQPVMTAS